MDISDILIWSGSALTTIGLFGILLCIITVWRAKRAKLDEANFRIKMQHVVLINMAALVASAFGLITVIFGIILGK